MELNRWYVLKRPYPPELVMLLFKPYKKVGRDGKEFWYKGELFTSIKGKVSYEKDTKRLNFEFRLATEKEIEEIKLQYLFQQIEQ